ncbi:MAG: hypothetical protein P4N41_24680 [Negativicutes bacterium]|nr:hypothetical protein [Negativicutes bacterium]MDR3592867.1 hypothetical protein [Negativicutes bacterium]
MSYREAFKRSVVRAVIRRVGVPSDKAYDMVEGSTLGALMENNAPYILFKGAEYWAEKIQSGTM